jgi:hypothetical protein
MALVFDYDEEYRNSRNINIGQDNFDQEFSFFLWGNFFENADFDIQHGADDDVIALQAAYSIIPIARIMPMYDGNLILLTLSDLRVESLQSDHWKVTVRYSIPERGGRFLGGYEQLIPPMEDNVPRTENYVQIGFETQTTTVQRNMSLELLTKQKSIEAGPDVGIPYKLYKGAPMGHHQDGVEGAEVFVPTFSFHVTAYKPPEEIDYRFSRRMFRMTGTLNNRCFFGFHPGTVMFQGCNASGDIASIIPTTFNFEMKALCRFSTTESSRIVFPIDGEGEEIDPNEDGIPTMFQVINDPYFDATDPFPAANWYKLNSDENLYPSLFAPFFSGWDHVDYRYGPETPDPETNLMIQKPIFRFVHRNQRYSDFRKFDL